MTVQTTKVKETTWRDLVIQADPDHVYKSRVVTEYTFTAPGGRGDPRTHEDGFRVFRGDYQRRGPYRPE